MPGGFPMKRQRMMEKKFSDKIGCRILLPSKMAGCLIGKGGSTINKLREDYDCSVRIPDCAGPERILEIVGKEWESVFQCLEAAIPYLYECPDGIDNGENRELRFLVHQAIAGGIIGKGGETIREIRESTGTQMKVYSSPAPQSTDRCVQVSGVLEQVMNAAREIYTKVTDYQLKSHECIYDPLNYDAFFAYEYGGFGGGKGSGGPMMRGGGHMMGGFGGGRGGGMGPGFGGGQRGFLEDEFNPMMGGFGGPGARGFGPPGGDMMGGGGYGGMAGFGRGNGTFGGGSTPKSAKAVKLEFTDEGENTFKTTIEKDLAGSIIGYGGQRIRKIRSDSGATIQIGNPENDIRTITIIGDMNSTSMAKHMIQSAIYEFASGPSGGV